MQCILMTLFFCVLLATRLLAFTGGRNLPSRVELVPAFPSLTFSNPVFLTHSGDGSGRLFVAERRGRIMVFTNDAQVANASVFLNIEDRVNDASGEMGLLGLAFHPDFSSNGFFYVNYTSGNASARVTVVSRFSAFTDNNESGDPESELILMRFSQPFSNHNAGMLAFGPDAYLYIATGDGGSGGDPQNNAQDRTNLLGKILRVDVDNPHVNLNYGIPSDNPLVNNQQNFREEIWAFGLRNPWRFSFDQTTEELWAGDVGQGSLEEINLIEKGKNYGWRVMEGTRCFNPSNCSANGLTLPIIEYSHSLGCSVTGGYVYRGASRPELVGGYIYGDYCSGRIWLLRYENQQVAADSLLLDTNLSLSSFGVDENNELYMLGYSSGTIHRFLADPATSVEADLGTNLPEGFALQHNYPNPFNPSTNIKYVLSSTMKIELSIFNTLGDLVATLYDGEQGPGEFELTWSGSDQDGNLVASGIYYYRLTAPRGVGTGKMVLIR